MKNDLFINNEWSPASSGDRFEVINPATEEVITEVASATTEDLDRAVESARNCFESDEWQNMDPRRRGKLLVKAADLLKERMNDAFLMVKKETG